MRQEVVLMAFDLFIYPCNHPYRIYKMLMASSVKVAELDIDKIHPSEEVHAKRFLKLWIACVFRALSNKKLFTFLSQGDCHGTALSSLLFEHNYLARLCGGLRSTAKP
jgi:hypothetical protein